MFDNPVRQRPFEPDIVTGLFGFDPFVLEDFLPFGLKFLVKRRSAN